jgi:hypothetical protein
LFTTREKETDGGAAEVFEACMDEGYWPENFRICGVNADGCIFETVVGLRAKLPNSRIEVLFVSKAYLKSAQISAIS